MNETVLIRRYNANGNSKVEIKIRIILTKEGLKEMKTLLYNVIEFELKNLIKYHVQNFSCMDTKCGQ